MAESAPVDLDALRASVTKQGATVRELKKSGAPQEQVTAAVELLATMRKQLEEASQASDAVTAPAKWPVNKRALDDCVTRRMFVVPAFEIHGGVAGLFDYGPPGCALKENLLALWRQHFVLEDGILQIECTTLTPYPVLKTSGHVDKFEDLMVKDVKTGECYRADKLLEDVIDNMLTKDKGEMGPARREELRVMHAQAGSFKKDEIHGIFLALGIKAPATGNDLTEPFNFNLMFQTSIGPTGQLTGFLRPETAQGMFVNFRRLLDYNNGRLPMAVAQIGSAYRNEIAPRGGLLRVREFTMAEIEHFVAPHRKEHAKFDSVKDMRLTLFPGDHQVGDGRTVTPTLEEAVSSGVINNQTLAYFMARTHAFLLKAGVKSEGLRFRQHLRTEMAHYACDCWDAEILMASGWVECVGIADRSAYDLQVHARATKTELVAREALPEPVMEDVILVKPDRKVMGKTFKTEQTAILEHLTELAETKPTDALALQATLTSAGSADISIGEATYTLTKDMVSFSVTQKKVSERKFVPNVIEPSFGIGRIITGILEHTFSTREGDEQRAVLSFPASIAPYKAIVLPLDSRIPRAGHVQDLASSLTSQGIAANIDDSSASIGKRYSRADEVGIPYGITVDGETLSATPASVTVRERDSCAQLRVPVADIPSVIKALVEGSRSWADLVATGAYPLVTSGEDKASAAVSSKI